MIRYLDDCSKYLSGDDIIGRGRYYWQELILLVVIAISERRNEVVKVPR